MDVDNNNFFESIQGKFLEIIDGFQHENNVCLLFLNQHSNDYNDNKQNVYDEIIRDIKINLSRINHFKNNFFNMLKNNENISIEDLSAYLIKITTEIIDYRNQLTEKITTLSVEI